MARKSKLLLDSDEQLLLLTPLACALRKHNGDRLAIVLQQIHYWCDVFERASKNPAVDDHYHDGRWWVYNTWATWQRDNFPMWSERTIQRLFDVLREMDLITTRYPAGTHRRFHPLWLQVPVLALPRNRAL